MALMQPTYTLHHQIKRKYPNTRKYMVMGIGEQHQADLIDMSHYAHVNNGYNFILTVIDIFSRKAWAEKVKNKSGVLVANALLESWKHLGGKPKRIQTDHGKEFYNKHVKNLGVEIFSVNSPFKASIVERFNRTLKEKMWKWFTKNNTKTWIYILPDLIETYNNSIHRSIKMTPNQVNKGNELKVWMTLYGKLKKSKAKLKRGTYVRISKIKKTFEKGYLPNWTNEVFVID